MEYIKGIGMLLDSGAQRIQLTEDSVMTGELVGVG